MVDTHRPETDNIASGRPRYGSEWMITRRPPRDDLVVHRQTFEDPCHAWFLTIITLLRLIVLSLTAAS